MEFAVGDLDHWRDCRLERTVLRLISHQRAVRVDFVFEGAVILQTAHLGLSQPTFLHLSFIS